VIGGSYGGGHGFKISSDPRVSAVSRWWAGRTWSNRSPSVVNYRPRSRSSIRDYSSASGAPFFNYNRLGLTYSTRRLSPPDTVSDNSSGSSVCSARRDWARFWINRGSPEHRCSSPIWDDYPALQRVLDMFSQITAPTDILGRRGHPPEGHSRGRRAVHRDPVLRWFDHYLRGSAIGLRS
jgi:hypothetical protein